MATKEELEVLKLTEELKQLKAPFWQKPSYLTIIASGLTIIISAAIGFSSYFSQVDQDNKDEIKRLESKIRESQDAELAAKDQLSKLESETYRLRYEDYKNKVEDKKIELIKTENSLKDAERRLSNYKSRFKAVSGEVENYISKKYAPSFTKGILNNPTNITEMKKYVENDDELIKLKTFISWVVNETYIKTNDKRKLELAKKLKEL